MIMLPKFFAIYVPTVDRHGTKIPCPDRAKILYHIQRDLGNMFGGCTTVHADGMFDGAREHVSIVKSFCTESDYIIKEREVHLLALYVKKDLDQNCVAIESSEGMLIL